MALCNVYGGIEKLTDSSLFNALAGFATMGTGVHYFLVLECGGKFTKLDWGPEAGSKTWNDVPGAVRVADWNGPKEMLELQGTSNMDLQRILNLARELYKGKMYNTAGGNCIGFCVAVCRALKIEYEHSNLHD